MRKRSTSSELTDLIKRLSIIRREHQRALDEIEATFRQLGIEHLLTTPAKGKPGRKPKGKPGRKPGPKPGARGPKKGKRTRGTFAVTGDDLILRFVKKHGNPTTEDIRKHWEGSGRGGKADNNLSQLVKRGLLVRNKLEGAKGSAYTLTPGVTVSDS